MQKPGKRKEFISIVIPAFNEYKRILSTLSKVDAYCRERFKGFEIIVINDGSQDDTAKVILEAQEKIKSVKLIDYKQNKGKGYAIRQGVDISKGDIIIISDADLSTPIEEVEKLLVHYDNGHDIIIGSRALKDSDIVVRQPWWRESMGRIFNIFVRLLLLRDFRDTQCGFKLFKGDIARELFRYATIDRFAYDVEILFLGRRLGYRMKEIPIQWFNSPGSKVNPIKDSFQMLKDLIKIRFKKYK